MKKLKQILIIGVVFLGTFFGALSVSAADYYAEYWNVPLGPEPSMPITDPIATTTVSAVNFFWGEGSPNGVNADGFVARFTKTISTGQYYFFLNSDDGSRLYLDGVLLMSMWQDQGNGSTSTNYTISNGDSHTLVVEYYENAGGAKVTFNYDLTVTMQYLAGNHGSISGTATQSLLNGAAGTAVTAVPDSGYHFVSWSDGSTANPRQDSGLEKNTSVTANFALNPFVIIYQASTGGTLTGSTTQSIISGSSTTAVEAVADTGYSFLQWDDGATTTSRLETNVLANATHTAEFLLNTFTLSYLSGAGGSLTGSTTQTVGYDLDGSVVRAIANKGYHFVNWSDGATSSARVETNVKNNFSVTANFASNPSSAPVTLPDAIGYGVNSVGIAMNETRNIQTITPGGTNILAYINSQADFQAPESSRSWQTASHRFRITELDLAYNKIVLTIFSEPKTISMAKGESREVDLDADGKNDVKFSFVDVYVNRAEITLESLANNQKNVAEIKPVVLEKKPIVKTVTTPVVYNFKRDLKLGMQGSDVLALQKYLNANGYTISSTGYGSKGRETNYFGKATQIALIRFQKDKGIKPAAGYFGVVTRKIINK